jgi:hypothetical protein
MRKATFNKTEQGYAPVNKLAKSLVSGYATPQEVQAIATDGQARPYVWTSAGLRQSFRG